MTIVSPKKAFSGTRIGFTMIEMLVIVVLACLFATIVLPLFIHIAEQSRSLACKDSLLHLNRANLMYLNDNECYSPGAVGDTRRWHGTRISQGSFSDVVPEGGFLSTYLTGENRMEMCAELGTLLRDGQVPSVEKGGYGYGYNLNLGSLRCVSDLNLWDPECEEMGVQRKHVRNPGRTVAFTDSASKVNPVGEPYVKGKLAEFAFSRSFYTFNQGKAIGGLNDPTIHFRHRDDANVAWVDGHVSQEKMSRSKGAWGKTGLGFIGSTQETLFEP